MLYKYVKKLRKKYIKNLDKIPKRLIYIYIYIYILNSFFI